MMPVLIGFKLLKNNIWFGLFLCL